MTRHRFRCSGPGSWRFAPWAVAFILMLAWNNAAARHVGEQLIDQSGASLESVPCWFDANIERPTVCFELAVPFDWTNPDSAMQHLPVVVFLGDGPGPPRDPIIFLNGGPGQRAGINDADGVTGWIEWLESMPWTHDQHFIVPTQRGTNWTDSNLHCATLGDPRVYAGASEDPGGVTGWYPGLPNAYRDCRDEITGAGIPIAAFNTKQNATDMAALRILMGIDQWTLYGVSYGTRLGLTLMRHDPDGVARAIFDSVLPPALAYYDGAAGGLHRSLRRVFDSCRTQAKCNADYPHLEASFASITGRLRRQPLEYAVTSEDRTRTLYVVINPAWFIDILFWGLYWWEDIELVPRLIHEFAASDLSTFDHFATNYFFSEFFDHRAHGMANAMWCNDDSAFMDRDHLARQSDTYPLIGDWIGDPDSNFSTCDGWPLTQPDPREKTPVISDTPALLLAGGFDPVTPPEFAHFAAATLARAHVFTIPSVSHDVIESHHCASELVVAFLDDPTTRPDTGCLDPDEVPDFK
jgi:pimeloyl-ACP methyl ester carboxylesterase